MKTRISMNKLLWITLMVIGLFGCSEEQSSSENTDPFVELVLPEMSVTTVYFKLKTN